MRKLELFIFCLVETGLKIQRCMHRASSYKTNKMHKILVIRLYFHYMFYMFRTVLVHHQEQLL